MKKILIACISLLLIASTALAQTNEQKIKKQVQKLKRITIAQKPSLRSASTSTVQIEQMDSILLSMSFMGMDMIEFFVFTNDANGFYTADTSYSVDPITSERTLQGSSAYTYDANNRQTLIIERVFDGLSWDFSSKYEYIYAGSNVTENYYDWNGSSWVLDPTESYTYTQTLTWGNCVLPLTDIKHYSTGEWTKDVVVLDGNNRVSDEISYTSTDGVTWVEYEKLHYVFNVDGKTAVTEWYEWTGSAWGPSSMAIAMGMSGTQYYSMISRAVGINETISNNNVTTYPNPTVDGFYVNAGEEVVTVTLFSLVGETMLNKEVKGTEYISVNGIPKGTYLVKLNQNGNVATKKLIIK